jgi:hypothetical protein
MPRLAIASGIAAAFVVATAFATPSDAAPKRHLKHQVVVADRDYYGVPPNYYPAPPFPFFLLPGPWWLPAHP